MSVIVLPHTPVSGQVVPSVGQLGNFTALRDAFNNTAVQTDVAKTIAVAHTWAADILFADALYDIGKSGATRPRDLFLARNLVVGGTATFNGASAFNKQYNSALYTLTDGATIAVDWNNGNAQQVTLGGNRTMTFANPVAGARYLLFIKQDATGSRTLTLPTHKPQGGTAIVLTTTANKKDLLAVAYDTEYNIALNANF